MKLKVLMEKELTNKIGVVVGTRPGIIKFSPVIRELCNRNADFFIIHTGQHYSHNMDGKFFEDLQLPEPKYINKIVREYKTHGGQTAEMIKGVEEACIREKPRVVIVGGDANTNLAGALAARKLVSIKVAHLEAGLRSNDWRMPEEHNRVIIDHISDILFAPTETAVQNLREDKVKGQIYLTGNTIVDAVQQNLEIAKSKSCIVSDIGLSSMDYFVLTLHREENVDSKENLRNILDGIRLVYEKFKKTIVFPVHPRTRERIKFFFHEGYLNTITGLKCIDPIGYLDFLLLLAEAALVMTDSGGIQEESCILHVPCVTLRENTERPETLDVGSNIVVGTEPENIVKAAEQMLNLKDRNWPNPYGNGTAAQKIVDILMHEAHQEE